MTDDSKASTSNVPNVFVSYSHDSPQHRRWVLDLASHLVNKGVNVLLDQWDVGPGADLAKYMEQSVASADRVVLICTEKYVAKANDGLGGVGYEAMVVTGELMQNLGTAKFIPVVRQSSPTAVLPRALSTRFYVNFSDGCDEDAAVEQLLRELHQAPVAAKPPIGANPFAVSPSGAEIHREAAFDAASDDLSSADFDPEAVFKLGSKIIAADDILLWRRTAANVRADALKRLQAWRASYERTSPTDINQLAMETMEGVACFSGLFALMLAAVGSGKEAFSNQTGLLEDTMEPEGWDRSGYTRRADLPRAAAFVYQALHGAMTVHVRRLRVAMELVRKEHRIPNSREYCALWRQHDIMGWPESLGRNTSHTWTVLVNIDQYMPWVTRIFGSVDDWQTALAAYYMALNVNEFASKTVEGFFPRPNVDLFELDIPLSFAALPDTIRRRAVSLLTEDMAAIDWIFSSLGTSRNTARPYWAEWIKVCNAWIGQVYRFATFGVPHGRIL